MQTYSLAEMATARGEGKPKGQNALMPKMETPAGFERSYLALLRRYLEGITKGIRDIIIPAWRVEILVQDGAMMDAAMVDAEAMLADSLRGDLAVFRALVASLTRIATDRLIDLLWVEGRRHTASFMEIARKTFSVDLRGIVEAEDLAAELDRVALVNAELIKNIGSQLATDVARVTIESVMHGGSAKELKSEIRRVMQAGDKRAKLIARDQAAKLNADLNRIRHLQAGITDYIWRTSKDERVRDRHKSKPPSDTQYKYGEKTAAEEGRPPGKPIQCRCIAQAVVEF